MKTDPCNPSPAERLAFLLAHREASQDLAERGSCAVRALALARGISPAIYSHVRGYIFESVSAFDLRKAGMIAQAIDHEASAERSLNFLKQHGIAW